MKNKKKSNAQEKKVAKLLDGRTQIASGALWFASADVKTENYLIECKTTSKDFYVLTFKTWEKIYKEAARTGLKEPLMYIDINNGKQTFIVLSGHLLLENTEYLHEDFSQLKSVRIKNNLGLSYSLPNLFVWSTLYSETQKYEITVMTWETFYYFYLGE